MDHANEDQEHVVEDEDGNLVLAGFSEEADAGSIEDDTDIFVPPAALNDGGEDGEPEDGPRTSARRSKRRRIQSSKYQNDFYRH